MSDTRGGLRGRQWQRFIQGPDSELLDGLYVPALSAGVRYDRCCAYFSSSVLAAAARGFGGLIQRLLDLGQAAPRPAVRLVVNEELSAADVKALIETRDTSRLEATLLRRLKKPADLLQQQRLGMLAWLVKEGLLSMRVGVLRQGVGIMHAKHGIISDEAGDAIVFAGSANETAQGLLSNYEQLEVSTSWEDPARHEYLAREFEQLWSDQHAYVHSLPLPEAVRLELIRLAPEEPPVEGLTEEIARQRAAMLWRFIAEAAYLPNGGTACDATAMVDLWPHQRQVVEEAAQAWPEGRLLCDEVGMGKTIEAILVLRRLLAGRGVRRALLLLPAGLCKQWQDELWEKGGLCVPWLDGLNTLRWPGDRQEKVSGLSAALEQDLLLMSRETARTEANREALFAAKPWDLVIMDEAHAARRGRQVEGEFNRGTLLLDLLRQLQLRQQARGILLLSATPMQTHPWEPWDLLSVLGEGGEWLAEFPPVRDFYEAVAGLRSGDTTAPQRRRAATLIASDERFPWPPSDVRDERSVAGIERAIRFARQSQREELAEFLRRNAPLARRMHRNTRGTLRRYHQAGLLPQAPPHRTVEDVVFDYADRAERDFYNSLKGYIDRRFEQLEQEKRGKGFVMTVYRRRATSSPLSIERSLKRRCEALQRMVAGQASDTWLSTADVPEALDEDDLPEDDAPGRVSSGLPETSAQARAEIADIERLLGDLEALHGQDSKLDRFRGVLRNVTEDGRAVLVFTQYTDTLEHLRDELRAVYRERLGCYSGAGGEMWDGQQWTRVTKQAITDALQSGKLEVLVCTDAASEGLNLQAAGAVINYDLPWNPSKVEQRIGRVDRIGQQCSVVMVVNLYLKDSVDMRVYSVLRKRCGLFEQFVGTMQPVLARARRMLTGHEDASVEMLSQEAEHAKADLLAQEAYHEQAEAPKALAAPVLSAPEIEQAVRGLSKDTGLIVRRRRDGALSLKGRGIRGLHLSHDAALLEAGGKVHPLTVPGPWADQVAEALQHPGERLPLVVGIHDAGAFRTSVAYWITKGGRQEVRSFRELAALVEGWDGSTPEPSVWVKVQKAAQHEAKTATDALERQAADRQERALEEQKRACSARLQRELGRYLVSLGGSPTDMGAFLRRQLARSDLAGRHRIQEAVTKLEGPPIWPEPLIAELEHFAGDLTESTARARTAGSEIDAALNDPRWMEAM